MTNIYEELEKVLDILDDVEKRAEGSAIYLDTEEYVKSGIRTAKHHVFQAMKAVLDS